MTQKIGVMVCGHGSRSQSAVDEFATLAEKLPAMFPKEWEMDYGYLEFANPLIRDGLDNLRAQGCDKILAVPGMLFAAMHSKNDIPTVLNTYAAKHGIEVSYGRELGIDPKMIAAAGSRIQDAVDAANAAHGDLPLEETALVVIGRGASDPDANSNVSKIARMLWEGMGFGWCEVGYSGVTFPLVEPCLDHVAKLGYKRVIVFPYFLFSGILIDRIYGFTDKCAQKYPDIQFAKAGYLGDHPKVLETFAERVKEQLGDVPIPNCGTCQYRTQILEIEGQGTREITPAERRQAALDDKAHPANSDVPPPTCVLCKYRTQVLGFESEVGAIQESHHHHVEGQGASAPGSNVKDCKLCDTFCTGECRLDLDHHHHHHHHDDHDHHHHDHDHDHDHTHDHHHHDHSHDHHHPVYPHAKHPHGPESARKKS